MARTARVEFVDALRGFALFGLLMVHCIEGFGAGTARQIQTPVGDAVFFLFAGKAFAIFALLFGFGFATIMANQRSRGVDFTKRFAWRLVLLFIVGTLHSLYYFGDILQVLALMGLLLIPLDRVRSNKTLLIAAAVCFAQIPLFATWLLANSGNALAASWPYFTQNFPLETFRNGSFLDVLAANATSGFGFKWSFNWSFGRISEIAGLFALGMFFQRTGFFSKMAESGKLSALIVLLGGAVLAIMIFVLGPLVPAFPEGTEFPIGSFTISVMHMKGTSLAMIAVQLGLLALLWNSPARRLVELFKLPGRMTLTLYVLHSVIAVPIFYGYGLGMWDGWSTPEKVIAGLVFFAAQILFARWWYSRYRYGPLEWTWRAATLTDWKVPMRIKARAA